MAHPPSGLKRPILRISAGNGIGEVPPKTYPVRNRKPQLVPRGVFHFSYKSSAYAFQTVNDRTNNNKYFIFFINRLFVNNCGFIN